MKVVLAQSGIQGDVGEPPTLSTPTLQAAITDRATVSSVCFSISELDRGIEAVLAEDPDLLGLSCYCWSMSTMRRLTAAVLAERPHTQVVWGGPLFRDPEAALSLAPPAELDRVLFVHGDGTQPLREIIAQFSAHCPDYSSVARLTFFRNGTPVFTGAGRPPHDVASPSPYLAGLVAPHEVASIEMARGCPHTCGFCSEARLSGVPRRHVLADDRVVADLRWVRDHGTRVARLLEPSANLSTTRLGEVCACVHRADPDGVMRYVLELHPDTVCPEQVDLLRTVPIGELELGLQTTHPEALANIGRRFDAGRYRRAVELLTKVGVPSVDLILGLPGDNLRGFAAALDFALSLPVEIHIYRLLVLPGTPLWRRRRELGLQFHPETFHATESTSFSTSEMAAAEDLALKTADAAISAGRSWSIRCWGFKDWGYQHHAVFAPTRSPSPRGGAPLLDAFATAVGERPHAGGRLFQRFDVLAVDAFDHGVRLLLREAGAGAVRVQVEKRDAQSQAYVRTKGFNLSYQRRDGADDKHTSPAIESLLRALAAEIRQRET